jgi:hypothetical protein
LAKIDIKMNEKIVCASIWYKDFPLIKDDPIPDGFIRPFNCDRGIVFSGLRHHNCLYQAIAITGRVQYQLGEEIQGFLTSKNRFVTRQEAFIIATKENQIIDMSQINGNSLYSEDIY